MLSPRRFRDIIVRRRQAEGERDETGKYVDGPTTETELRASVQPLGLEYLLGANGLHLKDRLVVYVPEPEALRAAHEDRIPPDRVAVGGEEYVVDQSHSWGKHTRAVLLRQTGGP